jgi:2-polyprenyl-6-methoxyphenol hydroxylase-like FAD-dependent oxidoreductase
MSWTINSMSEAKQIETDVLIIGAGVAGAAVAATLTRRGVDVLLVDPHEHYPASFKAEKIEPDQAELLEKFGLLHELKPQTAPIGNVVTARGGRVLETLPLQQFGILYGDIVKGVRQQLSAQARFRVCRVEELTTSEDRQVAVLSDGATVSARLAVLASGTGGRLHKKLGIERRPVPEDNVGQYHSIACGFDIARRDRQRFEFDALTYYADHPATPIDYLTLFLVPHAMRANMFTYHDVRDQWLRDLASNPTEVLAAALPGLSKVIGNFEVISKVEICPVDLYVAEGHRRAGLVLIGDACQSVCPATGTGLSKVLSDVDVLSTLLTESWLSTPGMNIDKINLFYDHPTKLACDSNSLQTARYRRRFATDRSLRWTIHRQRTYLRMAMNRTMKNIAGLSLFTF